jgi:hypothetical protein
MNHLNTLLREATTDAPPDHLDVTTVVRVGRSRVRRRRAVAGVAVAAVTGLAFGLTLVAPDGDTGDQSPAASPVELTLADAVPAKVGRDYEVLGTFTAHSTDEAMDGDFVRGVLPDGRVVVQRYPEGDLAPSQIGLIGEGTPGVVEAPKGLGNYLGATPSAAVFGSDTRGLWILDSARLGWTYVLEGVDLDVNMSAQPAIGDPEGKIFLTAGLGTPEETRRPIYRVDPGGGVSDVAVGGDVAAYGGRVAWTDVYDAPVRSLTIRSQDGTASFDPGTGECVEKHLGLTLDRIVLMTNCSDVAGDNEFTDVVDRIDVFDLDGRPLARITGEDLGPVRMTDRFLTIASWDQERAGTYTYDLGTGSFLRLTRSMSELAGGETGIGSTLVWEKRLDGDSGAMYVVARMR